MNKQIEEELKKLPDDEQEGIALMVFKEMRRQFDRVTKLLLLAMIIIAVMAIYHEYQWSQFDSVIVNTEQGGNANYIGQDGDVNNYGESGSTETKSDKQSEIKGNKN